MLYARKINRRINSGIYLGPTQGLSSPKNNRRACLCTDKDTYSRDCCNGNLIAQGVGNIQAPADSITSTTTTTIAPTTTSTSTSTSTSTTTATPIYSFIVGTSGTDGTQGQTACNNTIAGNTITIYSYSSALSIGVIVYSDSNATTPYPINNFITEGVGSPRWYISGAPGTIGFNAGTCVAPTSTTTSTSTSTSTSTTTAAPTSTTTSTSTSTSTSTTSTSTSTSTSTTTAAPTSTTTSTSTTSTTTAGIPIVTDGLIIWNHFTDYNTGSGTISDRSGNSNTAIVSGSTMTATGSLGLAFNGTNNYFTYPEPVNATPTGSFTTQFYGTINYDGNNRDFFSKGEFTAGLSGWDIVVTPDARAVYRPYPGGDKTLNGVTTNASVKLVTLTFNTASNQIQLYLDTTLIDTNTNGNIVEVFNTGSVPFSFGFTPQTDGTYFKGSWKDITLYNRVLTSGEITTNYNALSTL